MQEQNSPIDIATITEDLNSDVEIFTQFAWEVLGSDSDLSTSVPIEDDDAFFVQPGLKDIIISKIATLGHRGKFPRQYDWENLIPTLAAEEELFWIAHKRQDKTFDLYLGIKSNHTEIEKTDFKKRSDRFQILCDSFSKRAFPESLLSSQAPDKTAENLAAIIDMPHVYCLTGMPSFKDTDIDKVVSERDEEKRPFSSINDILEAHLNVDGEFYIIFSITPAPNRCIQKAFHDKFTLKNKIKPLLEQTKNNTTGKSWGTNEGISITPAHQTKSSSDSHTKKHNCLKALWKTVVGGESAHTHSMSTTDVPELKVTTTGKHQDFNESKSISFTVTNSKLKFVDTLLDESLKHLQQVPGTGGFFSIITVYSKNQLLGESLSRSLKAALSGSQSYLHPIQIFNITGRKDYPFLTKPSFQILQENGIYPDVFNCEKACQMFLLPDADLPGVKLKKSVFYSRPDNDEKSNVNLGAASYYLNPVIQSPFGKRDVSVENFRIPEKDLCSHVFLVGTTGSGKTERAAYILNNLGDSSRLLILETAKKTYRDKIKRPGHKLCVYTLGNSQNNPFRINPFYFEPGCNLKQHISVLADAIADLLPMEALIGPKLREAIENCYTNCGWNIETGVCHQTTNYPDMISFNSEVNKICQSLSDYGPEVRSNYRGALLNRSRIFIDGVYQDIFAYDGNKPVDQMFPPDTDVIIEMEDMPPSEINMPAFIISILLHRIRAVQTINTANNPSCRKFIVAIEEAHNVLSRKFTEKTDEGQSGKGGHLVNQVVRLLAEGRGLNIGIMVIDQSANTIAPAVIANSNMKIVFRQEDGEEIKTIGTAIGLKEEDWNDLQMLGTGECIIKSKTSFKPIKLAPLSERDIMDLGYPRSKPLQMNSYPCAPYIFCERILEGLYTSGVYTISQCKKNYTRIARKCFYRKDIIQYVVGKFLLTHDLFELLDYWLFNPCEQNFIQTLLLAQLPRSKEVDNKEEIEFLKALRSIVVDRSQPSTSPESVFIGGQIICKKLHSTEDAEESLNVLNKFPKLVKDAIECKPKRFSGHSNAIMACMMAYPPLQNLLLGFEREKILTDFANHKTKMETTIWLR